MSPRNKVFFNFFLSFSFGLFVFQNCSPPKSAIKDASVQQSQLRVPEENSDHFIERPEKTEVSAINTNKILTVNILASIFGENSKTLLTQLIANNADDFGGANSIYDRVITSDCNTVKAPGIICEKRTKLSLTAPPYLGLNIRREGWRLQACHEVTKRNILFLNALRKIHSRSTLSAPPVLTEANIVKAFGLFFIGKPNPSSEVIDGLTIVTQDYAENLEKWRGVFLTLCLSPHWQAL